MKFPYHVIREGMGGFLNPPLHPEHTYSLEADDKSGCQSLSYALECEWMGEKGKAAAKALLDKWEYVDKLPLTDEQVRAWIHRVLGYFRSCYAKPDNEGAKDRWNCDNLVTDSTTDPMTKVDLHAGVHFIRKYYPEYYPTADDFAKAKWGK